MRLLTSRQLLRVILVAALLVLAWLVAEQGLGRSGGTPTGQPSTVSATAPTDGTTPTASTTTPSPTPPTSTDPVSGLPWVEIADLPPEARETLDLIAAGGPYPYPRNDNQVFLNREGLLPRQARGYYREFTVETPGSRDRGARRIVTGSQGEAYWTDDHYRSFARIWEAR